MREAHPVHSRRTFEALPPFALNGSMSNGVPTFAIRPAGSDDRDRIQSLVRGLSPRSRYLRFFSRIRELAPHWLERFTRYAPGREATLLLVAHGADEEIPVGMAQYAAADLQGRCEFAVVVSDAWQGMGLGTRLVAHVVKMARAAGFKGIEGHVLPENAIMLRLARRMGFEVRRDPRDPLMLRASMELSTDRR
jgi:acetyltransferase